MVIRDSYFFLLQIRFSLKSNIRPGKISTIYTVYLVSEGEHTLATGGGAWCQAEALTGARAGVAISPPAVNQG